ncbi:cytochrome c [Motiliproteus sp. MSK22-1]|uniref:cytochrome c n=1 Tax=Motiliproteus sp. MSK22-1 TaxID=1897630 RepID=UPI000975E409|nr:cytochrome c [Motiliproteus sp. MSK22-1]OMH33747.1 cytochrome C [Motiliproteus sp. MSK22-1]
MKLWMTTGGSAVAVIVTAGLWFLSGPGSAVSPTVLSSLPADAKRGELVFHVSGCASCHKPEDFDKNNADENTVPPLSGGQRFETQFGTFIAPNITPDKETGIGNWSVSDFATAMLKGVRPDGQHLYPAFPYTSYARMKLQDIVDLKAYMDTLPAISRTNENHELGFPFSIRRGLGLWKQLYLSNQPVINLVDPTPEQQRGQYLVEGPGHCGECHTPRNLAGAANPSRWLAGAANPDGDGTIPNITPHKSGIAKWETVDITEYLSSGFTPDYDVVGGSMAEVVENTARLPDRDRKAIAAYLMAIPPVADKKSDKK